MPTSLDTSNPRRSAPATSAQLDRIAAAAVSLGALGPRLARLAEDMAAQARDQARSAASVAENMQRLTVHLEEATRQLRGSSTDVEAALVTVARIAEHTRMLATNASIEAARAGEHGKAFGVVVEEVQRLADRTGKTTVDIEARVRDMHANIARVAAMTGQAQDDTAVTARSTAANTTSVALANHQIRGIADSAGQQLASVHLLNALGTDVNAGTEALLLAVGTFRFAAHARAEREVAGLLAELATSGLNRRRLEHQMVAWIQQHPHFELLYFTNADGRQIIDNVGWADGRVRCDAAGYNRDWSARPWYRSAMAGGEARSSDIYRSTATGDFCFTVAAALRGADGAVRGVLGADVNFQQLLAR